MQNIQFMVYINVNIPKKMMREGTVLLAYTILLSSKVPFMNCSKNICSFHHHRELTITILGLQLTIIPDLIEFLMMSRVLLYALDPLILKS